MSERPEVDPGKERTELLKPSPPPTAPPGQRGSERFTNPITGKPVGK
ncbi:MAG: hypothetical protein ACREMY_00570 [bacterium]